MADDDFTRLPDLASRRLGGSVVYANDELFAERENLIKPEAPAYSTYTFGHKGQVYDGWETRRRREPGHDFAIVRLGAAGVVRGVVVDTAFFKGNYPPEVSVEGTGVEGYPSPAELQEAEWVPLVPRSPAKGDAQNPFPVEVAQRFTHVRLCMYPDGGVARLRVHGEVVAGDQPIWLHRVTPEHELASPHLMKAQTGGLVVRVDDVDAHYARSRGAGASIDSEPADQPYGQREYGVRDPEGHRWWFATALT